MRVIDASVIVKLCVEEHGSAAARAAVAGETQLVAPAHAFAELGEILARKARTGQATFAQIVSAAQAIAPRIRLLQVDWLLKSAIEMSISTGASVYDCLYVVAAIEEDCQLLTADIRLVARMKGTPYSELLLPLDSANAPR